MRRRALAITRTVEATLGGHAVVGRALTGRVDNAAYPAIDVDIQMTLVTPKDAKARQRRPPRLAAA